MNLTPIISPLLLTALLTVGCTAADHEPVLPAPSAVEILPQALVAPSRANLSGAQDGPQFPASTDRVFAVSAFINDADGNPTIPYFLNQPIRSDADGAYHFHHENGLRYYPEDGTPLYFYAVSPACAEQDPTDPKKLIWTLTGQEDIMVASDLTGIAKEHTLTHLDQPHPNFHFNHLLTRLNFRCRRETGFADYIYITYITIKNQNTVATLNLDEGSLTFSNLQGELTYILREPHMVDVAVGYNDITSIMIEPTGSYDITIGMKSGLTNSFTINASELTWDVEDVNHGSGDIDKTGFKAGCSYNVNLRFQGVELKTNVTLAKWNDGGSESGVIYPN